MEINLLEGVVINISTIDESLMLKWLFSTHDYDEIVIGDMDIKCKWQECQDGRYYKDGKYGKYVYDLAYPNTDGYLVELKDIELDVERITKEIADDSASYNYKKYSSQYLAGVRYNYKEININNYTDKNVTCVACPLSNVLSAQDLFKVYFECDASGKTKVFSPVIALHSNLIYSDIEHIGTDEFTDAEVFNFKSKADPDHLVGLEILYDNIILATNAYRLYISKNGILVHE